MNAEKYRSHVRAWIDQDEKNANIAVDTFLESCRENGVAPTFEQYYGSTIESLHLDYGEQHAVHVARMIALGYVLRGRLDELMPKGPQE